MSGVVGGRTVGEHSFVGCRARGCDTGEQGALEPPDTQRVQESGFGRGGAFGILQVACIAHLQPLVSAMSSGVRCNIGT